MNFRLRLTLIALLGCLPFAFGADIDRFAAFVNGEVICESEIGMELRYLKSALSSEFERNQVINRESALEGLIQRKLILNEARRFKSSQTAAVAVDEAYKTVEAKAGGPEPLSVELKQIGMSQEELRQRMRDQLLIDSYILQRIKAFISVNSGDIDQYIQEHRTELKIKPDDDADSIAPELKALIEKLILEREINRRLEEITKQLRDAAEIQYPDSSNLNPF